MFGKMIQTGGSELDKLKRQVEDLSNKLDALEARPRLQKLLDEYKEYSPNEVISWRLLTDSAGFYRGYPFDECLTEEQFKVMLNEMIANLHRKKC